jgi:DNA-binding CsgD family transcriptional regulator
MTKVLIFKHPDSFGVMEVELPPERIVREINQGRWDRLMSDVEGPLYARVQGDIVVVTPSAPIPVDQLPKLSRREHQVLVLVGEGLTTAQIALKLGLRPRTIRGYVASMKARLDAQNIQQLVTRAVALGLFHPDV